MANYEELKEDIRNSIKTNGNKEITGQVLQDTLIDMVDELVGNGMKFDGFLVYQQAPEKLPPLELNTFKFSLPNPLFPNGNGFIYIDGMDFPLSIQNGDIYVFYNEYGTLKYDKLTSSINRQLFNTTINNINSKTSNLESRIEDLSDKTNELDETIGDISYMLDEINGGYDE